MHLKTPSAQEIKTWNNQFLVWPFPQKPARDVQLHALSYGYGHPGFAYFMRMRLGKTLLAIAEFTLLREENKVDWFILICPNSLKEQWENAIEEVDPYTPICVYESQRKIKTDHFFKNNKKGGVLIINYESVRAFMEGEGWQKFNPLRTYLCADESTKIKEPSKKMTKAALELASICSYCRILTGKPKANSNTDLWAQLKFISATVRNYHQHKYYFSMVGGFQGRQAIKDINTEVLKEEIKPFSYIAPDHYITGFEKIYEPMRFIELQGEQKELYEKMEEELIVEIGNDTKITAPIVLVKYLRLQQISSGIVGDIDGNQHNIIEPSRNPRIQTVLDIIESEVDNKVIIACRFKLSIKNLYDVLTKKGHKCAVMIGGMGSKIETEKAKFNSGDCNILIAQLQVLSFGHTLPGPDDNPCDSMIFYENDFSLINRAQAESRPEKMERGLPISYYDMYASPMDKYIINALIKKEDGSMAIMGYARKYGILSSQQKVANHG